MSDSMKLLAALLCMSAWALLVWVGLTPVDGFVGALRDILIGLGVFATAMKDPKS